MYMKSKINKNQNKMDKKQSKGITLIALVITIIVLLILAGVTINTLFGNESVLEKASEAKEEDAHGKVKDQIQLELVNYELEKGTGETSKTAVQYLADKGYFNETYSEETESYTIKTEKISNVSTGKGASKEAGDVYVVEKESEENNNWLLRYYKTNSDVKDLLTITSTGTTEEIIKDAKLEIGDYVEYNIPYKDVYSYHEFTKTTGWRVLDKGTDNGDGTFSNVKLISTRLDSFDDMDTLKNYVNDGSTNGKWAGNESDVKKWFELVEYNGYDESSQAPKIGAGLYYNFEKTLYDAGKEPVKGAEGKRIGRGCYKEINGQTEGEIVGNIFLTDKASEVHNLLAKEVTKVYDVNLSRDTNIKDIDVLKLFWLEDEYRGVGYYEKNEDTYEKLEQNLGASWFDYWFVDPRVYGGYYLKRITRYDYNHYDMQITECLDDWENCLRSSSCSYFKVTSL